MKKKGYWVLLGVIVMVGGALIASYCFQGSPVVQDVNAQMGYSSNIGGYLNIGGLLPNLTNATYDVGREALPSYGPAGGTAIICDGRSTSDTCHIDCGWTSKTCFNCSNYPQTFLTKSQLLLYLPFTEGAYGFSLKKINSSSSQPHFGNFGNLINFPFSTSTLFGRTPITSMSYPGGFTGMSYPSGSIGLFSIGTISYPSSGFNEPSINPAPNINRDTSFTCPSGTCGWCANPEPIGGPYSAGQSPAW